MKVGDYVRTKKGIIGKIKLIDNQTELEDLYLVKRKWYYKEDFIKSAEGTPKGLLSLIEVGDIVNYEQLNGGVVLNKKDDSIDTWSILPNSLKNEDIKSVITKEQLKNCMYEVGE